MDNQEIDKAFISPVDKFLYGFDQNHKKSLSQLNEIKKHNRVAYLRDHPVENQTQDII